jgi:hypothetical protein
LCVTHGWLRYDYSHNITEILLKEALNTRTHNHSSEYSLFIMRVSTFREILVSLQKKAFDSYWSKWSFDIVNILAWAEKVIQNHFGPQYFESNSLLGSDTFKSCELIDDKESRLEISKCFETTTLLPGLFCQLSPGWWVERNQSIINCVTDDAITRTGITKWPEKPVIPPGHVHVLVFGNADHVSGVMLANAVDRWSEPRSGQAKTM